MQALAKIFMGAATVVAAAAIASSAFAQARTEFATFQPNSAADGQPGGVVWLNNNDGPPTGWSGPILNGSQVGGYLFTTSADLSPGGVPTVPTTFGAMDTLFNYHNIPGVPTGAFNALFSLSAISTMGAICDGDGFCDDGDLVSQGGINGSFSFINTAAFQVGNTVYAAGSNLLTGVFTGARIIGVIGDANGALSGADRPLQLAFNNVNFSSDVVTFAMPSDDQITLNIGAGAFPSLGTPGDLAGLGLNSYRSTATGSFAASPPPFMPGVPEPGTWAMMIVGFGMAGAMVRRRRIVAA